MLGNINSTHSELGGSEMFKVRFRRPEHFTSKERSKQ